MESEMIAPVLKYPGAKWKIADWITSNLPHSTHYLEPYFGSGAIYFNLPWQPAHVLLNDISGDIANLFRVIRDRGPELAALIEMTPYARDEFTSSYEERTGDELEDAGRFLVRCWMAIGGKSYCWTGWRRQGFHQSATVSVWNKLPARLLAVVDRLKCAEIENRPAIELIRQYASPKVLIYADPPYPRNSRVGGRLYGYEMTDADHEELLDVLIAHPGPVALSSYPNALYDERLVGWVKMSRNALATSSKRRTEVLWLNERATMQGRLTENIEREA
jgi:DNA adenine methylase